MQDNYNSNDSLTVNEFEKTPLPTGLNILTILTFIGCAFGAIFTLITPWLMNFFLNMMDKSVEKGTDLTPKQATDMEASRKVIELTQSNMVPLLIIGAVGIILCFVGALMMRKLKKDGFWIYVAGQVLPIIGSLALLGMAQFTGVTSYIMFLIPVVFIILYATQRKYLVK
ncbi:MAG: hypothetical protein LH615_04455 [Ferruginibacter sp.]|nr:hypothetical protein [Ferruginibacter sp.]